MMFTAKMFSAFFGIGYIKGGGTIAALLCTVAWYAGKVYQANGVLQAMIILVIFLSGTFVSGLVEKVWGHDSNKVVIDEVAGMTLSLFLLPAKWPYFLAAFLLFRFFDIAKPLFIRKAEAIRRGWGVMLDDMLAGAYTVLILHLFIFITGW